MESTVVQVSEPGRTPLCLQLHRPLEIGRDCDGVLLTDALLSRRHLRLSSVAGRVTVEDLGSTNGIRINGEQTQEGKLHPGDEVTIGNFVYQVCGTTQPKPMVKPDDD